MLALGRLQAIFTPIFCGYGAPAIATRLADCEASRADHRGRLPPTRRVGAPQGGRGRGGRRRRRPSAGSWSCGARARRSRRRGTTGATRWWDDPGAGRGGSGRRLARSTPRRRTCSSTPRARPAGRRAPSTSTAASRSRPRRTSPTTFDLGHGDTLFWFTDLGWMMGPWAIAGVAAARRAARALRGRAGLPGPGPAVGARRAPPGHPPRPVADRHPRPDGPRRGAGPLARPLLAARAGLDRRALEPRALVVVLPRGRRGALPDRQLLAVGPRSRAGS